MKDLATTVDIANIAFSGVPWALLMNEAISTKKHYFQRSSWNINIEPAVVEKLMQLGEDRCQAFYQENNSAYALITLTDGGFSWVSVDASSVVIITVFAKPSKEQHLAFVDEALKIFPIAVPQDDKTVQVKFWMNSNQGAIEKSRRLDVPSWEDIHNNYPQPVLEPLTELLEQFTPSRGGQ